MKKTIIQLLLLTYTGENHDEEIDRYPPEAIKWAYRQISKRRYTELIIDGSGGYTQLTEAGRAVIDGLRPDESG